MKRVFLFVVTNIAVLLVLSVAVRLLGLDRYLTESGMSYGGLLAFAAVFGMGGAFLSLAMSKFTAKRMVGARAVVQVSPSRSARVDLSDPIRLGRRPPPRRAR